MTGKKNADFEGFLRKCSDARERHGLVFDIPAEPMVKETITLLDLRDLAMMQNLFYPTKFASHRKIIGPIIVFFKERLVRLFDPFLRRRLARQFEINQFTWNLANIIRVQQLEISNLTKRVQILESRCSVND